MIRFRVEPLRIINCCDAGSDNSQFIRAYFKISIIQKQQLMINTQLFHRVVLSLYVRIYSHITRWACELIRTYKHLNCAF